MLIKKKRVQILGMLLLAGILSAPLSACSKTMDPKSIAKPPVATTNERGQKDPDKVDWGALETEPEELTEAAKTLRDLDMGYFVGAPDILNAYYMFDNPQKYYSDWPTVGLHFPTDEEYNSSPAAYKDIISLIEGLDQSQLDESQIREVKDMLFDFTAYEKLYENWIYAPQLNPMGGKQMTYPLLTSLIQFQSKADVERYFLILGDYYTFFSRAVEVEKMRSEKGIGWNDENLDRIIADCQRMQENRDTHFLKTTFESRLGALHLSDQETADYMKKNQELLDTVYFPTMEMLIEKLQELKGLCNDEPYLAETVEGKAYYEALFAFRSGVSYTVDECKDMLQAEINRGYELFTRRCAEGRGISQDEIKKIGEGRVWSGVRAKEIGLVDELGSLQDALAKAAELAELEDYEVAEYPEPEDLWEKMMKSFKMSAQMEAWVTRILGSERYQMICDLENMQAKPSIQARLPYYIEIR